MFDRATGSYWSQLLAQATGEPLTGERLTRIPSTVTTGTAWRETHPDTSVLLPPPHSGTMPNRAYPVEESAPQASHCSIVAPARSTSSVSGSPHSGHRT